MTPEERRAKLEKLLIAGDYALALLILRRTGRWIENIPDGDQVRAIKMLEHYPDASFDDTARVWYPNGDWTMRNTELEVQRAYHSVEEIFEDALSLGFVLQVARESANWKANK